MPRKGDLRENPAASWHGYTGSIMEIIYSVRTIEELAELERVILAAIMSGKLRPQKATKRRWVRAVKGRLAALQAASLYGPDGRPVAEI